MAKTRFDTCPHSVDYGLLNAAVSSELPDPETNPKLFEFVKSHMIHGPCGNVNKECPCMAGEGVLIEIAVKKS